MNEPQLALSIRQPWSELLLQGRKTVELRGWDTEYRGLLWLHAGKFADPELDRSYGISDPPRGAFVGRLSLIGTSPLDAQRWERWRDRHLDPGPYQAGMFAWIFSSPERLPVPVPAPGKLKLFDVEDSLVRALRASLG